MGRRSISSTKAGKYMNPTDQARKELNIYLKNFSFSAKKSDKIKYSI
jgi:hypothetical protein